MPEETPSEGTPPDPGTPEGSAADPIPQARRKGLTPEQRRFLGTPRTRDAEEEHLSEAPELEPEPEPLSQAEPREQRRPEPVRTRSSGSKKIEESPAEEEADGAGEQERRRTGTMVRPDEKASRAFEMRKAIVILGALFALGMAFYVGTKIGYWKYRFFTARNAAKMEKVKDDFPGVSAEELVTRALAAERGGNPKEAARLLIAAKHKDVRYRGILFRVGRIAFDKGDLDGADQLFAQAIEFNENVDTANHFRGLIAVRRKDPTSAQRYFEAAAVAGPFVPDYPFSLGEALRMGQRPREAIPRFAHAALLTPGEDNAQACQFKIRMARLEAGEASKVTEEIEERRKAGPLTSDWLMTAAALAVREGRPDDAVPLIGEARTVGPADLFALCAKDFYFRNAAEKHPQIAAACGPEGSVSLELGKRPLVPRRPGLRGASPDS